jgi:hypothetical protein
MSLLTIFLSKWPYVMIYLAVCIEGVHALFLMLAVALSRRQYKEMKEKWPLKNLMLLWKCLASTSALDQSLIISLGMSGALSSTFPLQQQNPCGSCSNFFAPQWGQSTTGFSICASIGMLLYTFSYGSGTSGIEVMSSSRSSFWTSSSSSSSKRIFKP